MDVVMRATRKLWVVGLIGLMVDFRKENLETGSIAILRGVASVCR